MHMVTDYDEGDVAARYKKAKAQSWRKDIEAYTFLKLIGNVRGKKVVDMACGEGHYTRMLRKAGATEVVGLDISERMIELAHTEEAQDQLGIDYRVQDIRAVVARQDFDLAVSAYLLVYARSRGELAEMCSGIANLVRPGGRFVTINTNPDIYHGPLPDFRKYGGEIRQPDHLFEGAPLELIASVDGTPLTVENYYLPMEAYKSALTAGDFTDFAVHSPEVDPASSGSAFGIWDDFLNTPIFLFFDCVKT